MFHLSEPSGPEEERTSARIGLMTCLILLIIVCIFAFDASVNNNEFKRMFIYLAIAMMIPMTIFAAILRKLRR